MGLPVVVKNIKNFFGTKIIAPKTLTKAITHYGTYRNGQRLDHVVDGLYDDLNADLMKLTPSDKKFAEVQATLISNGGNTTWNFPTDKGFTHQNSIIVNVRIQPSGRNRHYYINGGNTYGWIDHDNGNYGGRIMNNDSTYFGGIATILLMRTDI